MFKRIILIISLIFISFSSVFAEGIKVKVKEKVPGANCEKDEGKDTYTCKVKPGLGSVKELFGGLVKYATFLVSLAGVLYIVINGITITMSGVDQGMKDEAKKRITMTLIGLILLLISGVILQAIAPWVYK